MVTRTVVLTLLGISAVLPVRADGILEQMQNEVAAITVKTRAAVVAVEDERKRMTFQFFAPDKAPNEDEAKRIESLQKLIESLDKTIAERDQSLQQYRKLYEEKRNKETLSELDKITGSRNALDKRRTYAKRQMEAVTNIYRRQELAALENASLKDQIKKLAQYLTKLEGEIATRKTQYGVEHPSIKERETKLKVGKAQLKELEDQLAWTPLITIPQGSQQINLLRSSSGTGFSIGEGYIITTADVVEPMENPVVVTDKGTRIKAKIVGVNGELNIGLLKLLAETDLPALILGDSQPVRPGHFALSIGNQTGDPNSVALNLVGGRREQGTSAGNRFYPTLIQIAGTVGAGTSGAPLMNAKGEVIGIVVAVPTGDPMNSSEARAPMFLSNIPLPTIPMPPISIGTPTPRTGKQNQRPATEHYERAAQDFARTLTFSRWNTANTFNAPMPVVTSAGYALPINEIKAVIEQLKTGQVTRGWIGIAPEDEEQTQEQNGIINTTRQVRITGVFPESPALEAGIQPGDVLLRINDKPVRNSTDVRETSMRLRPGDTLTLRIIRFDKHPAEKNIELKISPRPMEVKPAITTPVKKNNPL